MKLYIKIGEKPKQKEMYDSHNEISVLIYERNIFSD